MSQRTLLVFSGNFAFGCFQLSLVVLDDELPYSLDLDLSLTRISFDMFQVHVLDPVAMDVICDASEIFAAEVEDCDGLENREADCFVLGTISYGRQISELRTRPRFARLHQHVVSKIKSLQGIGERLCNCSQWSAHTAKEQG